MLQLDKAIEEIIDAVRALIDQVIEFGTEMAGGTEVEDHPV